MNKKEELETLLKYSTDLLDLINSIVSLTSHHNKTEKRIDTEEMLWTLIYEKVQTLEEELKNVS